MPYTHASGVLSLSGGSALSSMTHVRSLRIFECHNHCRRFRYATVHRVDLWLVGVWLKQVIGTMHALGPHGQSVTPEKMAAPMLSMFRVRWPAWQQSRARTRSDEDG